MSTKPANAARPESAFVTGLLKAKDLSASARLIATHALELVGAGAAILYTIDDGIWSSKAVIGPVQVDQHIAPDEISTLASVAADPQTVLFSGPDLARESYAHLQTRRTLLSLAYVPFIADERLISALEVVSFDVYLGDQDLAALAALTEFCLPALEQARAAQADRIAGLKTVARLTQLYDLEKTFHSTLEMDALLPLISSKFRDILSAQAVHIWMVQSEAELVLKSTDGDDPTVEAESVQRSGEGVASHVGDSGEPLLIDDPADPHLAKRNQDVSEPVLSLIAAPLMVSGEEIGVVEVINKTDGTPFSEEDLFLFTSLCDTAAGALHNASLLQAERKLEILETLVRVSTEITSTLDLDRVLQAVVNGPASVIPYERAAIALQQRGRFQLRAISGQAEFDDRDPQMKRLEGLLQWATLAGEPLLVRRKNDIIEVEDDREETRTKFADYFDAAGMSGFHAVPLADDEGMLGMLSFESSDPDFLSEAHVEMIKVLAGQATVALRNASLYREVPFINVLEPLIQKKKKFLALDRHRRAVTLAIAGAVLLFLFLFPLPYRVEGDATVFPIRSAHVQPQVEGVIQQVFVREGDSVHRGALIAQMEDGEYRAALAAAQSRLEASTGNMNRALASSDGTEAGIQRNEADFWSAEVARAKERLEASRIRSPIDGIVATPHIEDFVGKRLQFGDPFADIINSAEASIDVAVDEEDVGLLHDADRAWIKLDGFPNRTFQGRVTVISPKADADGTRRVFFARVQVPNDAGLLRVGMQGRGKVLTGWRPAGVVIFRRPAIAVWTRLWSAFGW